MKILLIKAHPRAESFCHALADSYASGAVKAGNQVEVLELHKLAIEAYLKTGHKEKLALSEELVEVQNQVKSADMLVFAYPTWWASPPALLKLFLELILLSGFAYKYQKRIGLAIGWDKLLKGKSARLIATMDGPPLYYRYFIKDPGYKMMNASLRFCGIKPVRRSYFGSVKLVRDRTRQKWLQRAYKLGLEEKI